jgi:putative FmdB family regulatory protein
MPTYEYECQKCGRRHEAFQSITSSPLRKCPHCKKMGLKRLIGRGAGIIFKGSGFYETDYKRSRTSSSQEPAKDDAKPSSETSKPEKKSDTSGDSS